MDSHPYEWLKTEMADVWQGFEREQVRGWFAEADLVNVLLDCSGESCHSTSSDPATDAAKRQAEIDIFVASGTKRVAAHELVQAGYGARAESSGGCCSPATESAQSSCCTPAPEQLISNEAVLEFNASSVLYTPGELGAVNFRNPFFSPREMKLRSWPKK